MSSLPKTLIVDANILFSFFKSSSERRRLIKELPNLGCKLISPKFAFHELLDNKDRIKRFGKINELAFIFLFSLLELKIESFPESTYKEFLSDANKISPHPNSTKDDPYFALSLVFNKCLIWLDEEAFKQQSKVKIFSTEDLLKML